MIQKLQGIIAFLGKIKNETGFYATSILLACESIRFSFALRRWGRFAKRPQRRRAKEKRILSQATILLNVLQSYLYLLREV